MTSAADLADLKGRVTALETSVAGALSSIAGLLNTDTSLTSSTRHGRELAQRSRHPVGTAEGTFGNVAAARLGYVSAQKGTSGRLGLTVDLPTIYRNQTVTVKVNGVVAKSLLLNSWVTAPPCLTKAASAPFSAGQQVQVLAGATVVATSASADAQLDQDSQKGGGDTRRPSSRPGRRSFDSTQVVRRFRK